MKEMEAARMIAIAKVRSFPPICRAASNATGSQTSAAAAFDIGWVRRIVSTKKPARIACTPSGASAATTGSARMAAAPLFCMAVPNAAIPPINFRARQSITLNAFSMVMHRRITTPTAAAGKPAESATQPAEAATMAAKSNAREKTPARSNTGKGAANDFSQICFLFRAQAIH